jgi:hypothetical protein
MQLLLGVFYPRVAAIEGAVWATARVAYTMGALSSRLHRMGHLVVVLMLLSHAVPAGCAVVLPQDWYHPWPTFRPSFSPIIWPQLAPGTSDAGVATQLSSALPRLPDAGYMTGEPQKRMGGNIVASLCFLGMIVTVAVLGVRTALGM